VLGAVEHVVVDASACGEVINLIPDDVGFTVLTPQQAPQLYTAIDLLKTLWLWVGLLGLAALIGALVISRRRRRTPRAWSVTTAVLGLLLVIAMRVAQGPLLIHVKPANAAVATAIYEGVAASLRAWTLWFVAIPVVVLVFTLLWGRLGPSARWAGVAAGALVLVLWPAPTLTVQIWVVALIALHLGVLEWLQSRAAALSPFPARPTLCRPHPGHRPTGQRPPEYRRPRRPVPRRGRTCRPWAAGSTCSCGWVKRERPACSPTTSSLKRRPTCWRHRHRIRDQPGAQPPSGVGSSMSRPPAGDATAAAAAARPPGPPEAQPGAPGWTAEAMSGQPDLPDQ
jgi:hypothetical protein